MKKFYTLLTLCLAFIGITTASAQNAPEFSNEKCYTVKADRSSWVTSTAGLKTLNDLGLNEDSTDPNQQFAFLTKDGATYLYSVGQAAFITKSGSLGAFATDPVYFTPSKDAGTFMVYFDDSHYINIGGSKQMAISNWKTGDIGNNYTFTEAGEFDPTSALASATPSAAISDLSELSNEKLYTVQQKNRGTSWAVASDAMVSSKQAGVVTGKENDPKQQFAFITSNETTYIYYAADKKFVNKDGSLSETPVDPIAFVNGESEGTFVVKFDDSHYVNVGGSGNMEINDWSTADNGNSNTFTPVADFDPTEVLKLFAPATPEATTVVSIDPACGELEAMPSTVKVTFSNDIKAVNVAVLQSNATGAMGGYQFTAEDYTISGKELTLNLPEQYVSGQALALIILQVVDVNDQPVTYSSENTDYAQEGMIFLQYTAPLKSDLFAVVSADPAEGSTVSMLDVINVTFGNPNYTPMFPGQSQSVGGFDSSKEVVLLDAAGDVVTKASMEAVQENGWNTATVAFTLDTPVSTNGKYTLVIPAGTVYNEMYYEFAEDFGASYGALYNPEVCLNYTVGTSIEFYPEVGEIPVTTETLTFTFSKEIQAVNEAIIQSSTVQLPPLTADVDYFFWGNELSINLPREYTLKAQDLSVILQVIDEDGNPVTYHNHSFFPEQEGMIFVEYTLVPVEPTIVEMSPEPGEISAVERSIYLSFNTDIAEVEVAKLQSTSGEMPELVLDENLFVWGKDISIVLPLEYTAKASDLSVVLKVKDIQGKYVTYGEEADMVNLAYTLVPVTPTVEDAGAEGYTITTATSAIDIMFSTPLASVTDCMINAHWGSKVGLEEGVDYSIYDNILTVNLPKELLAEAAEVEEANRKIVIGFVAEDIQGKQVVYTNSEKWDQETAEDYGMTFLEYSIVKVTEVESVSPECGFYEVLPSEITLTFDTDIKAVDYGTIHTQLTGFRGYMMTEDDYVIDGNKLTINVPEAFLVDQSLMQIRMNVVDVKGMYVTYAFDPGYENEGAVILEYTAPVKADLYKMVSSDPAEGAVEKLDVINVAFEDAYGSVAGGFDPSKEVVVLNAAGEVVAKAAMEVVFEAADEYGWAPATNVVKFTLDTPVTETGIYTFVIPAGTVYNEMFYPESEDFGVEWGALYNPEISITYTIGDVTGINGVTVNGKSEIYSIDGRKVTNPTKGIYVVNGKKVVVK